MSVLYSTSVKVVGGRQGRAESDDGLLAVNLSMPKELGGKGGATNPEQLFAAGYAACFDSALQLVASQKKLPLSDSAITAIVDVLNEDGMFKLGVALKIETSGILQSDAEQLAAAAHAVCPYSNAIKGNVDVTLCVEAA